MRLEHCIRRWLGLRGHFVRAVEEVDGALVAHVEPISGRLPRCGCCGRTVRRTKGRTRLRRWRDLMIRHLPLVIAYTPRRVDCPDCGVRVERVPWANRWSRVTKSLSRAVAVLARKADLSTVAGHYALNWKTVANILGRAVQWGLGRHEQQGEAGESSQLRLSERRPLHQSDLPQLRWPAPAARIMSQRLVRFWEKSLFFVSTEITGWRRR